MQCMLCMDNIFNFYNIIYMEKKTTQPENEKPVRVKGTGIFEGENFSFKAAEQGEPTQLNVKSCKGGKTFETTSEKKPLKVVHLTCPANAADPYREYLDQLEKLGIKPATQQKQPEQQRLMDEGCVQCWLNQTKGQLIYSGVIDLSTSRNWQADIMRQVQLVVRRLPAAERFKKILAKIKKGGSL